MTPLLRTLIGLSKMPGVGPATLRKLAVQLTESNTIAENPASDTLLPAEYEEYLVEHATTIEELLESLHDAGVEVLCSVEGDYPVRLRKTLGDHAPTLLYTIGAQQLLHRPTIGISGSRQASPDGIEFARKCGSALSRQGYTIVSGNAAGVDRAAETAALESGGSIITVLPEGILSRKIAMDADGLWDDSRGLLLSEFPPNMSWTVGAAMQRNQTICGLAEALIVIEPSTSGGTLAAARASLKLGLPLFLADYPGLRTEGSGSRELLSKGAISLTEDSLSNLSIGRQL